MYGPQDRKSLGIGLLLFLLVLASWGLAFFYAPVDAHQGPVYRIIFLHVPSAFTAFAASFVLFLLSIWGLKSKSENSVRWSKAVAEVGFLFTVLTLATGSIWGRPTWGTWWTWDARLTTTFLLALLYAGFLLLYAAMAPGRTRTRACGVLGILIFADVPIIYKSVSWWRTLHQPPSIMRQGGASMSPEMLNTLLICVLILFGFAAWLSVQRARNLGLREELERASFQRIR